MQSTSHDTLTSRISSSSSMPPQIDAAVSRSAAPAAAPRSRPTSPRAQNTTPRASAPNSSGSLPALPAGTEPAQTFAPATPRGVADAAPGRDISTMSTSALEAAITFADRLARSNAARRPPPIAPPAPPAAPPAAGAGAGGAGSHDPDDPDPDDEHGGSGAATGSGGGGDAEAADGGAQDAHMSMEVVEGAAPGVVLGIPLVDDALDALVNPPSLERSSLSDYATAADHWLLTDSKLEQYEEFVARGLLMVRNMARSDPRFAVTTPANWLPYARDSMLSKHGLIRAAGASAVAAFAASGPGRDAIQKDPLALTRTVQMLMNGIAAGCDNTDTQYAALALANIAMNVSMRQPLLRNGALQRAADVLRAAIRLLGGTGGGSTGGGVGPGTPSAAAVVAAAVAATSGGGSTGGGGGGGNNSNSNAAGRKAAALLKATSYIVTMLTCLSVDTYGREQLTFSGLSRLVSELQERAAAGLGSDHPLSRRLSLLAETGSAAELLEEMAEEGAAAVAVAASGGGGGSGSGGGSSGGHASYGGHASHVVGWELSEDTGSASRSTLSALSGAAANLHRGVSFADGLGRGAGGAGGAGAGRATAAISALQKLVDPEGSRAEPSRGLMSQVSMAARSITRKASMAASAAAAAAASAAASAAATLTPRGSQGDGVLPPRPVVGSSIGGGNSRINFNPSGTQPVGGPSAPNPLTTSLSGGAIATGANHHGGDGSSSGGGGAAVAGVSGGGGGVPAFLLSQRSYLLSDSGMPAMSGINQAMHGFSSQPAVQQQLAPPSSMIGVHFAASVFTEAAAARSAQLAEADLTSNNRRRTSMTTYLSQMAQSSKSVKLPSVVPQGFSTSTVRSMNAASPGAAEAGAYVGASGPSSGPVLAQSQSLARNGSSRNSLSLPSPPPPHHQLQSPSLGQQNAQPQSSEEPSRGDSRGPKDLFSMLPSSHSQGQGQGYGQGAGVQASPAGRPRSSGVMSTQLRSPSALPEPLKLRAPSSTSHKTPLLPESGSALSPTGLSGSGGGGVRSGCNSPLAGRQDSGRLELPFHLVRSPPSATAPSPGATPKVFRLTAVSPSRRPSANGNVSLHGFSRMYTSPDL